MIPAELAERIVRLHYVEHWKVGTIASQIGVHHSTVKRVLGEHGVALPKHERRSMVDPYLPFIHEVLAEYPTLPASRLYTMVVERGYPGGPDHFRGLIAKIRPKPPAEAYLRLRTLPAEEAQMDWGYFGKVQIGSTTRILSAFVMVLSWSRMPFVRFFYDQRMPSFLAGHVEAFRFFAGVPRRVLYDYVSRNIIILMCPEPICCAVA